MTSAERKALKRIQGTGTACAVNLAKYLMTREKRRKPSLRKAEKEEKKLGKKGARADVRAACAKRAGGCCEACACLFGDAGEMTPELDHFLGRARSESVKTCWMLCRTCHRDKTENYPNRDYWDRYFNMHCIKYGYPIVSRLTRQLTGSKA